MENLPSVFKETQRWMNTYIKSFYSDDEDVQWGISIKEKHTGYVTAIARQLARHLRLSRHDVKLAELMGLLHDVGRFRQYQLYKTFNDAMSEDHADLGLKVISDLPCLEKLTVFVFCHKEP